MLENQFCMLDDKHIHYTRELCLLAIRDN
jgi:hypothetical protein